VTPTHAEYVTALREAEPALLDGRYRLVTEFGRSLLARSGFLAARMAHVKEAGGRRVALTHAGAQVPTRTALLPDAWPLRVSAFGLDGRAKTSAALEQDVAGPLRLPGDVLAHGRLLPELAEGDRVVLHDTGAYRFTASWSCNSLPPSRGPRVPDRGRRPSGPRDGARGPAGGGHHIVRENGLDHADALLDGFRRRGRTARAHRRLNRTRPPRPPHGRYATAAGERCGRRR
jgi:diaminopimelate decarboxylase